MTSKERVQAALRRQPVDRVPVWMWYHPETARRLAAELEIPAGALGDVLGDDIRQAWVSNNWPMAGMDLEALGGTHTDFWGVEWEKHGAFNQIRHSPLQDAAPAQIAGYRFPTSRIPELMRQMEPVMRLADRFFVGCDISPCLFEMLTRIRGMEGAIMDLAAEPDQTAELLSRAADFAVCLAETACDRFTLDWLWTGDDVGGQQAMMMSPAYWREHVKPHLTRIFAVGKTRGLWVAYHSCGAIHPIIPDLIEIGLDVLNPIQCNCPGMDPVALKREFGGRLAFMGGVDTQELLPKGSADAVFSATRRLVETMTGDGGGYILAASHTVPPETPTANILAMYAAAGMSKTEIYDRAASRRARG